jgi:hypothetical protein
MSPPRVPSVDWNATAFDSTTNVSCESLPLPNAEDSLKTPPVVTIGVCPSSTVVLMPLCIRRVSVFATDGKYATAVCVLSVKPPPHVSTVRESAANVRHPDRRRPSRGHASLHAVIGNLRLVLSVHSLVEHGSVKVEGFAASTTD